MIAAEGISLGGPPRARVSMAISLCLGWGVIVGLSETHGVELLEVRPKQWQHAITPGVKKIDYDVVYDCIHRFVEKQAYVALNMLKKSIRNHALDAVGIGVFAALMPEAAQRITGATP